MKRWDLLAPPQKCCRNIAGILITQDRRYLTPRGYRDLDTIFPLTRSILTDNIVTILLAV